jgi:hypothetical protein
MEIEDQTLNETPEKETSEGTAKENEQVVPLSKFVASQNEAIRLKKENDELKASKNKTEVPEEEVKLRTIIEKIEAEKAQKEKEEKEKLSKELDSLGEIYGEFNKEKLLQIVERYGVYKDDSTVNWDRAMELYQKLDDIPTAPIKKIPSPKREAVNPLEVDTKTDVTRKSMSELVEEGLKKFGIK